MVDGHRPLRRHDGSEWAPDDPLGVMKSFVVPCVVMWIKGDWSEHAHRLGLANWGSLHCPCSFCSVDKVGLHLHYRAMSCMGLPI